jgi:hypothetical protein
MHGSNDEFIVAMDKKIWCNLSEDVVLLIYQKLPINEFFKLRVVCKEWNHVASTHPCIVGDGWEHNKMFIQRFKATRLKL